MLKNGMFLKIKEFFKKFYNKNKKLFMVFLALVIVVLIAITSLILPSEKKNNKLQSKTEILNSSDYAVMIESKIENYATATSDEIDENHRQLLLNGICVALKMGNPQFEMCLLSVSQLYDQITADNIPMFQWPLYVQSQFENACK